MAINKTQRNKLAKLLRQACLARDKYKCIRCGNTQVGELSASHIYPKGAYPAMRWDLENVKILDYKCHIHFFHKNPLEAAKWIKTAIPKERLDRLLKLSQSTKKGCYDYKIIKETIPPFF